MTVSRNTIEYFAQEGMKKTNEACKTILAVQEKHQQETHQLIQSLLAHNEQLEKMLEESTSNSSPLPPNALPIDRMAFQIYLTWNGIPPVASGNSADTVQRSYNAAQLFLDEYNRRHA